MKKTFSLVEVIVGVSVLAALFVGLLATFVGSKRYIIRAHKRLAAVKLAEQVLNGLYTFVREDTWDRNNNELRLHTTPITYSNIQTNYKDIVFTDTYSLTYTVSQPQPVSQQPPPQYRQVDINLGYKMD